jgi:hypothetical protein
VAAFLDALASPNPTPGGGTAAATGAALLTTALQLFRRHDREVRHACGISLVERETGAPLREPAASSLRARRKMENYASFAEQHLLPAVGALPTLLRR